MKVYSFEKLDSTNEYMKQNVGKFDEYDIVTAKTQTAGKARRGNVWISDEGMALFTFLVKKKENISDEDYMKLPLIAGISVIRALNKVEPLNYMFKWTNDIYLFDKKLCGILTEKVNNNFFVGIGININNFVSSEIKNIAISLREATNKTYDIEKIMILIVEEFKDLFQKFEDGYWEEILKEINSINYLKNKKISIKIGNKSISGIGKNINIKGEMEILTENNNIETFSIGEIVKIFY